MATLSNSSIQPWLDFSSDQIPSLRACTSDISANVTCAQVCNDSASIFQHQPSNLVTCGVWTTIVGANGNLSANESYDPFKPDFSQLTQTFKTFGLIPSDFQYTASYADIISNCLEFIYRNVKEWSFSDNGNTAAACTRNELFPLLTSGPINSTTRALKDCLKSICSPLTLNPDLAGIGVSPSDALS